jgi:hypothetical protein
MTSSSEERSGLWRREHVLGAAADRRSVLGREPLLGDLLLWVDERHRHHDRVTPVACDVDL